MSKADYIKALELESFVLENDYDNHFVDVVAAHVGLATTDMKIGHDDDAKRNLHRACEMLENISQDDFSEEYAYIFYDIGLLYEYFNETDKALEYYNHALKIEETMFFDDDETIYLTLKRLSEIYGQINNLEMAEYYKNRASLYPKRVGG